MAQPYDERRWREERHAAERWRAPGVDRGPREPPPGYRRDAARDGGPGQRWPDAEPGRRGREEPGYRPGGFPPARGGRGAPERERSPSAPYRGAPVRPASFRHEDFRRESERDAGWGYFGTGAPGVGGTGFTGGRFGYGDDRPYPGPGRAEVDLYREQYPGQSRRRYPPGPKGYQRSDERLREDISERLLQAEHIDSSDVTVEVTGGKVRLEGTVPERRMKHAIEDLVDACPGVQDIENRLKVRG